MLLYFFSTVSDTLTNVAHRTAKDTIYVLSNNSTTTPIIIASIAVLVSAISVIIAVLALRANIKHYKVTVQPILKMWGHFSTDLNPGIGIELRSSGLGPALIKEFKLSWNKIEIDNDKKFTIISNALNISDINYTKFYEGDILHKDERSWILFIRKELLPTESTILKGKIKEIFNLIQDNINIKIVYSSLYDKDSGLITEEYPNNDSKKWFALNDLK